MRASPDAELTLSTSATPGRDSSAFATARSQWSHVMPWISTVTSRVSFTWQPPLRSLVDRVSLESILPLGAGMPRARRPQHAGAHGEDVPDAGTDDPGKPGESQRDPQEQADHGQPAPRPP